MTPGDLLDERRAPEPSAAVAARVVAARAAAAQRLRGIGWRIDADVPGPVLRTRWRLPSGITSGADLRLDRGELPPDATPQRHRFLVRNRLIAGLTAGTVVVVAGVRSGALATARQALRMGRAVMGVPGPVTSAESAGVRVAARRSVTLRYAPGSTGSSHCTARRSGPTFAPTSVSTSSMLCREKGMMFVPRACRPRVRSLIHRSRTSTSRRCSSAGGSDRVPSRSWAIQIAAISALNGLKNEEL